MNVGFFNEASQFCLRMEDLNFMHKHYEAFYHNRISHLAVSSTTKVREAEHYSHQPIISKNSHKISMSYRQKIA